MGKTLATFASAAVESGQPTLIQPDSNGYREIVLGGFNLANRNGINYPLNNNVVSLFSNSGDFQRRVAEGNLMGERSHPNVLGMTRQAAFNRMLKVDQDRESHHIKKVRLEHTFDENKRPIVLVWGWVLPQGDMSGSLKEAFENPDRNVAFSIRSFVNQSMVQGVLTNNVYAIHTYDYVGEGGVKAASKFSTLALEDAYEDIVVSAGDLEAIWDSARESGNECGLETLAMVRTEMGDGWVQAGTLPVTACSWY